MALCITSPGLEEAGGSIGEGWVVARYAVLHFAETRFGLESSRLNNESRRA